MLHTSTFLTLDGVMADPQLWHPTYASDESVAMLAADLDAADAMIIGRRTNDEFASYWPAQPPTVPLARRTNEIRKWVATSRPGPLGWDGAEALEGDAVEAIRRLRDEGGDGAELVRLVAERVRSALRFNAEVVVVDQVPTDTPPIVDLRSWD